MEIRKHLSLSLIIPIFLVVILVIINIDNYRRDKQITENLILANNISWPDHIYSVITGFLEKGESSEQGTVREVEEELGLRTQHIELIEVYPFYRMNQIILGYYVRASGTVKLNEELRSYKHVKKQDLFTWDSATGYILKIGRASCRERV